MGQAAGALKWVDVKGKQVQHAMEEDEPLPTGDSFEDKTRRCCPTKTLKYGYVALGVITTLFAIWSIVVSLTAAVFHQRYNADPSSRSVGLVLAIVSAFISISIIVSGSIALIRRKYTFMVVVALTLVAMAVFQAALAATTVNISQKDEELIGEALAQSFKQSKFENTKEHKLWTISQHDLECCGLNGPDDYRDPLLPPFFAPSVPISCCPQYNPDKSEASQNADRAKCLLSRSYYKGGCKESIVNFFKGGAIITTASLVTLIGTEVLLVLVAAVLYRRKRKPSRASELRSEPNSKPASKNNETKTKSPSPEPAKN